MGDTTQRQCRIFPRHGQATCDLARTNQPSIQSCRSRSLSALLPVAWVKSGRIEKKVISEHKKLAGTSDIDAKVLYVKLARGLPTFGVHFFLVKVRETDRPSGRGRRDGGR